MPYFNPHSFRKTLAQLGQQRCRSPEEFKAWSQNLWHEGVLTTFSSYGAVQSSRQAEIMRELAKEAAADVALSADTIAEAIMRRLSSERGNRELNYRQGTQ